MVRKDGAEMVTHGNGGMKTTPRTKKRTLAQVTNQAVNKRRKHVRPNAATKKKAAKARPKDGILDFPDIYEGGKLTVEPVSLTRLSSMMLTVEDMAGFYGISLSTMNRRLRKPELREAYLAGRAHGKISLRAAQIRTAHAGNPQMQIWLGKQYLGQKNEHLVSISDEDTLPDIDDGVRMVSFPWTPDMEEEMRTIEAEYPEIPKTK